MPARHSRLASSANEEVSSHRDSNALRASIFDVALQLGLLEDNSKVADWIYNDPALQDDGGRHASPIAREVRSRDEGRGYDTDTATGPSSSSKSGKTRFSPGALISKATRRKHHDEPAPGYDTDDGTHRPSSNKRPRSRRISFFRSKSKSKHCTQHQLQASGDAIQFIASEAVENIRVQSDHSLRQSLFRTRTSERHDRTVDAFPTPQPENATEDSQGIQDIPSQMNTHVFPSVPRPPSLARRRRRIMSLRPLSFFVHRHSQSQSTPSSPSYPAAHSPFHPSNSLPATPYVLVTPIDPPSASASDSSSYIFVSPLDTYSNPNQTDFSPFIGLRRSIFHRSRKRRGTIHPNLFFAESPTLSMEQVAESSSRRVHRTRSRSLSLGSLPLSQTDCSPNIEPDSQLFRQPTIKRGREPPFPVRPILPTVLKPETREAIRRYYEMDHTQSD